MGFFNNVLDWFRWKLGAAPIQSDNHDTQQSDISCDQCGHNLAGLIASNPSNDSVSEPPYSGLCPNCGAYIQVLDADAFDQLLDALPEGEHGSKQQPPHQIWFQTIVNVGGTKGGVGKTTIAVNLAIARALAGRDVWLIDGDRQGAAETT
jgi:hypothetical protein